MLRRPLPLLILGVACFVLATASPAAQRGKGGGGKPSEADPIPGTAVLRCPDQFDLSADVICGDGDDTYVDGTLGGDPGVTVQIVPNGNFILRTSDDPGLNRAHVVRIPDRDDWFANDCAPQCVAAIPEGGLIVNTDPRETENAYFRADVDGGLANMPDGTVDATLLMGFPDPDPTSDVRWSLYWNPEYYAGTDYGTVTRSGCTWTITADANALTGFWLFRVGKGKYKDAQEGRFEAPLEITFTADPSACASAE